MKINGKIIKGNKIIKENNYELNSAIKSYHEALEKSLIGLCKKMDITVPLWLNKNTKEFVRFRRAIFIDEQFIDKVDFDRFEIKVES